MTWAETSAATAKRQAAKAVMTVPFEPSSMIPVSSVIPTGSASAAPVESLWKIQNRSINVPVMQLFSICSLAVKLKTLGVQNRLSARQGASE
ncbi:MAG: hypothetical protein J7493_02060 [Porphyrobacter sp.]|nr:hypothetical protein [Porphyrobacter sp.]